MNSGQEQDGKAQRNALDKFEKTLLQLVEEAAFPKSKPVVKI
jgi:hypothetical protein